jgi:hypothetical protein
VRRVWGYRLTSHCGGIFSASKALVKGRGQWGL